MSALVFRRANYELTLDAVPYDAVPTVIESDRLAGRSVSVFCEPRYRPQSAVRLAASVKGVVHWERTIAASGPATTVGERSAVCLADRISLALGQLVICVSITSGKVLWAKRGDTCSCFEVYRLAGEQDLVVHGECDITRLSADGAIVWRTSGMDIFTGPFAIRGEVIEATDFLGNVYAIQTANGETAIVGQGRPWPHTDA